MIPAVWIIGAGLVGILGVAAIVMKWDDVLDWLHDFLPKVSKMIRNMSRYFGPKFEHVAIVVADFVDKVNAKIEHKLYHKLENGQWLEETTTRQIPESELPPAVKRKLEKKRLGKIEEADITEELELELGTEI